MVQINFNTALGRLLRDPVLRLQFRGEPAAAVRALELRESDRHRVLGVDADQLDRQAEELLRKRFHEVARLMPRTIERLGADAYDEFERYAIGYWPSGHRRHVDDAARFGEYLR